MSEGAFGFLLLVLISSATALVIHWFTRSLWSASAVAAVFRLWVASVVAAVLATVIFQVAAYWHAGRLDKFFPIAVVVGGFWSFVIALMIGWLFRAARHP